MTKVAHMFSFQEDLVEHYSYGNKYLFVLIPFDTLQMCYNYNSRTIKRRKHWALQSQLERAKLWKTVNLGGQA